MEQKALRKSAVRLLEAVTALGFDIEVKELSASTRTAQEAANALNCEVAQIAKSLIFKGGTSEKPILIIASGVNRVNEKKVGAIIGEKLMKADADFVFEQTGYKIGGIPPAGHKEPIQTLIDRDILTYDEIWAAAGTPHAVFKLTPDMLTKMTGGQVIDVK